MYKSIQYTHGKNKRIIINKLLILDDIDYDLVYSDLQLVELEKKYNTSKSSLTNRMYVMFKKFISPKVTKRSLENLRTFGRYSDKLKNGFAISVAVGRITDEDKVHDIICEFNLMHIKIDEKIVEY